MKKILLILLIVFAMVKNPNAAEHGIYGALASVILGCCILFYKYIKQKFFPTKQRQRQIFFPPNENQQTMTIDEIEEEVIKNEETMKINQRRELIRKKQY